jgi:predicted transposase/invertase (TIGR01784 family)
LSFDNICKYLASEYPAQFVSWLLAADTTNIEILPTELSRDPIRADALILLQNTNHILHLEFQTLPESIPPLPLRMLDYWVRLYRQYQRPIEQVVIFLKETSSDSAYIDQLIIGNTQHRYRVVRLWEQDSAPLLTNQALLPFCSFSSNRLAYRFTKQVAARIDMIEEPDQQRNISACVEVLASLRFDKNFIQQFLRAELMQESPIYQEIIEKGVQRGKQDIVMRLLTRRIGSVSPQARSQIQNLSIEQLDELSEVLLDLSDAADLTVWLQLSQRMYCGIFAAKPIEVNKNAIAQRRRSINSSNYRT